MKKLQELKKKREEDEARRLQYDGVAGSSRSETALSELPEPKSQSSLLSVFNLRDPNVLPGSGDQFLANRKTEYQKLLAKRRMQLQEATSGNFFSNCIMGVAHQFIIRASTASQCFDSANACRR